ncbi:hypothetical protein [Pinibacter soli]|uniref:Uncharacterized protein n=1 Tax=Pinibacter soli TaxID=3044211 RepID=A0ABT6RFN0_9BACT|nr:hypothetical protein [Pinibacter soli]MDI3321369.1 hypothetical protein [Pinibacter soli]
MISSLIDWPGYCKMMALALVLYYGFVGVKFYKYEILHLFGIKKETNEKSSPEPGDKDPEG